MSEEKKEKPRTFLIENTVRKVGTRLHRARSATRHRFKQFIAGKRVLRNKKLPLTEGEFRKHEKQIVELVLGGIVAVHTPENIRVTSLPNGQFVLTKMGSGAVKVLDPGEIPTCFGGEGVARVQKAPPEETEVIEEADVEADVEEVEPDDLTELPGVGAGRARKLESAGISTFQDVVDRQDDLPDLLNLPEEVAYEIVAAASEKLGG